jgi:hypothetical protein
VALGAAMSLHSGVDVTGLDGAQHTIALAPSASQEAIKELGTNGGGFFNANSAHPFESPNGFTNIFEIFLLLLIPFSLPRTFGKMVRDNKQGFALLGRQPREPHARRLRHELRPERDLALDELVELGRCEPRARRRKYRAEDFGRHARLVLEKQG